jgi:hypothetical protein
LGLSGSTKGIRTEHNSTRSIIQGVDNTLNVSYQPIMLSGSVVELGIAGVVGATLDASGNLGLGVTPANWASGRVALQIGNTPYIIGPNIELGSNFYVNSGYKYIATGEATSYEQNAGSHKWKTAASGTAGNAITFTQAATLDASGNFMVGVTSTSFRMNATVASGADKDIFAAQISGASNGLTVKWNHSTTTTRVNIANLPTSSAGLAAGDLYNDSGTLKVA